MRENRPSGLEGGAKSLHLVPTPIPFQLHSYGFAISMQSEMGRTVKVTVFFTFLKPRSDRDQWAIPWPR